MKAPDPAAVNRKKKGRKRRTTDSTASNGRGNTYQGASGGVEIVSRATAVDIRLEDTTVILDRIAPTQRVVSREKEVRDAAAANKKKHKAKRRPTDSLPSNGNTSQGESSAGEATKKPAVHFANSRRKQSTGCSNWHNFINANLEKEGQQVKTMKRHTWKKDEYGSHQRDVTKSTSAPLTKVVGLDCEMVGVGDDGRNSILARVSIVNQHGHCLYDKFVKPREKVTDYRTFVSGIRSTDLENADEFEAVQTEVANLLHDRILVGHAIKNDLDVLFISHPRSHIRDTAKYFRQIGCRTPSLKSLASKYLDVTIQEGEHSSVQDARAVVLLYSKFRKQWEKGGGNRAQNRVPPDNPHQPTKTQT